MRIAEQIVGALEAAHAAGIVHGDVRPGNIAVDEGGNAYLSSFPIATGDRRDA